MEPTLLELDRRRLPPGALKAGQQQKPAPERIDPRTLSAAVPLATIYGGRMWG
jgi:hypothetical protein